MLKSYADVRDWLEGYIPQVYGKEELGLARIEELLKRLGNPERKFKSIHIAGTSGKGSTAFYIARLLESVSSVSGVSKAKIGLHISPHLVDVRERMQIFPSRHPERSEGSEAKDSSAVPQNDSSIMSISRFLELMSEIKPVVEAIEKEKPELTPSYFEILVAATFKYFADEKVDIAVVEVGLGGRLDATNVLMPEVAVITNIGLDHTDILGETISKIASEKAGIIKSGIPIVTAAEGEALEVIEKAAKGKGAGVIKVDSAFGIYGNTTQETFLLVTKAIEIVGFKLSEKEIEEALSVGFPGRFEEIEPGVILDGAHNSDKIRALISWLTDYRLRTTAVDSRQWSVALVLAFKKGKDWKKMIDMLIEGLPVEQVIATEFQAVTDTGMFAAVPAEEICDYVTKVQSAKCKVVSNSQEAVFAALDSRLFDSNTLVLVTGSLYLVGEARPMWGNPDY